MPAQAVPCPKSSPAVCSTIVGVSVTVDLDRHLLFDAPLQHGVVGVDAAVDHRDAHALRRSNRPTPTPG